MRLPPAVAAAAVVLVALATGPAWGVVPSPELTPTPARGEPGTWVTLRGSGFPPPEPKGCELLAFDRAWDCTLDDDDGARGSLRLADAGDPEPGTYTVVLCAPDCADPWGGRAEGHLSVERTREPDVLDPRDLPSLELPVPEDRLLEGDGDGPGTLPDPDPKPDPPVIGQGRALPRVVPVVVTDDDLILDPPAATGDDVVTAVAPGVPSRVASSACDVTWDGRPVEGTCTASDDASVEASVLVPAAATDGDHDVAVCRPRCDDDVGAVRGTTTFVVRAAEVITPSATTTVPTLVGQGLAGADTTLDDAGLRIGEITGFGDRVVGQVPPAGSTVPVGSGVDLVLGPGPAPTRTPTPTVEVAPVVGETVARAERLLREQGLVLADPPDGDGLVESQQPPAGSLVPVGTAVRVVLERPAGPPPWVWGAGLGLGALLAGGAASMGHSLRRARVPHVVAVPDPHPRTAIAIHGPPRDAPALRLRAFPDDDPTVRTEVHR